MGVVTKEDVESVVAKWTGIPVTSIKEEEMAKLLRIEEHLHKRIISQDKAISALVAGHPAVACRAEESKPACGFVPLPGSDGRW